MSNIIEETDLFNELLNWAHTEVPDAIFIEKASDAIFIEQASDAIFIEQAPDAIFIEQASDAIFIEQASDAIFIEQVPDAVFIEQAPDAIFIEQVPDAIFIEQAPDAVFIEQAAIKEAINQHALSEVINQDTEFIKNAISEIKTQMALIETRSNQIDIVIQNITQITIAIDNMKVELAATDQLENKYTILHKIMMFEISYVVITRAFLTSIEAAEIAIINMVEKTITIAVMIAAIDKTNKNAEIIVSKLTDLMVTWKKKTNEAEIAKNEVIMFITSTQTPTSLLNLPEIITAYTTEINKRTICNTFIDIVKQWIFEYS